MYSTSVSAPRAALRRVLVARDERDARRDVAVGYGDAGVGRGRHAARDAGDHLEGDAGLYKLKRLLAAAPEDVGVTTLEAHRRLSRTSELDEDAVDLVLLHRLVVAGLLAYVDHLGARFRVRQQRLRREAVVDDGVGPLHAPDAFDGKEARVAGARAHEVDHVLLTSWISASTIPAP
jgi:hypothetical protein